MEIDGSLPCYEELITGLCSDQDILSPHPILYLHGLV
jgi:hypothetical protein